MLCPEGVQLNFKILHGSVAIGLNLKKSGKLYNNFFRILSQNVRVKKI